MNANQIFAELNAAINKMIVVPNNLLPTKLHGKTKTRRFSDGSTETEEGSRPLTYLINHLKKSEPTSESREEMIKKEKARRVEEYAKQVASSGQISFVEINDHDLRLKEMQFAVAMKDKGVILLTEDDL